MNERLTIEALAANFPRHSSQLNALHTCDAELVDRGTYTQAFTIDEFSADEDGFSDEDPCLLGANLATATLSDILAAGATPELFMQAVCLPPSASFAFAEELARGVAGVLDQVGCHLIGGDLGNASTWRFTGWAMGRTTRPLTRLLPADQSLELWISGPLGDANAALAANLPTPRFECRHAMLPLLQNHAVACMDTSGGLWDALWTISHLNPQMLMVVEVAAVPLAPLATAACESTGLPTAAALIGGAGEYELLFAAPSGAATTLADAGAIRIGTAEPSEHGELLAKVTGTARPAPSCPDARAFTSRSDYLAAVVHAARALETPA